MFKIEKPMDFSNVDMLVERCRELAESHQKMVSIRGEDDGLSYFIYNTLELNKKILLKIKGQSVSH